MSDDDLMKELLQEYREVVQARQAERDAFIDSVQQMWEEILRSKLTSVQK